MPSTVTDRRPGGTVPWLLAGVALAAALVAAARFPAVPFALTTLIALAAAVVFWRPAAVLVIIPAAMPLLDLATLSGRVLIDEFDLLQAALLPLAWVRARGRAPAPLPPRSVLLAFGLLATSFVASIVRGGWPWPMPDATAWAGLPGPWDALRVGKGAIWAVAFILVYRRIAGDDATGLRLVARGLLIGLVGTVAVVLWERAAFVGLFDFEADYRVTGPFSAMNTGGATIECFLAVGAIVATTALLECRRWPMRVALGLLIAATWYAVMVTYSRNGWFALFAGTLVVGAAALRARAAPAISRLALVGVVITVIGVAAPVLKGGFAQQRLARIAEDWNVRAAHWRDALALRDDDALTWLIGVGVGRFPVLHRERSAELPHAGTVEWHGESAAGSFVRLGPGHTVYVEQWVDVHAGRSLEFSATVRPNGANLGVALCEKWMLTSLQCARIEPLGAESQGDWQRRHWRLDTAGWASSSLLHRPVKLALYRVGDSPVDVTRVQLADDRPLLANGDFESGLDRWFYATDVDPPWHIHSLPVALLFEQGWLGAIACGLALITALTSAVQGMWRTSFVKVGVLAALVAVGVSAAVNNVIDTPRMMWLCWLMLCFSVGKL